MSDVFRVNISDLMGPLNQVEPLFFKKPIKQVIVINKGGGELFSVASHIEKMDLGGSWIFVSLLNVAT